MHIYIYAYICIHFYIHVNSAFYFFNPKIFLILYCMAPFYVYACAFMQT